MNLTANFTLAEFQSVSDVQLDAVQQMYAQWFATHILQPLRDQFGWPIKITSFVRSRDVGKPHEQGNALDFQPCKNCPAVAQDPGEFARRLEAMFVWLAQYKSVEFGTLIDERTHLHVTRPGFQSRTGYVLREPTEGNYVLANILPIVGGVGGVLILLLIVYLLARGKRVRSSDS